MRIPSRADTRVAELLHLRPGIALVRQTLCTANESGSTEFLLTLDDAKASLARGEGRIELNAG
jgi:hypothetical protein